MGAISSRAAGIQSDTAVAASPSTAVFGSRPFGTFPSRAMEKGIASLQKNAPGAKVIDLT